MIVAFLLKVGLCVECGVFLNAICGIISFIDDLQKCNDVSVDGWNIGSRSGRQNVG